MKTEETEALVSEILHGRTLEKPSALFELIKAVADPNGDANRYDVALDAMRAIEPQTKEYEKWFQTRTAVKAEPRTKRKAVQQ